MDTRNLKAGAASLALLIGGLGLVVGGARAVAAPDEDLRVDGPAMRSTASEFVSDSVRAALSSQRIDIAAASSASGLPDGVITQSRAIGVAANEFGLTGSSAVQSASLVRLSTPAMGAPSTAAPGVKPLYADRLVWLVTFADVANPVFGTMGTRPQARPETESPGTMATFIDAVDSSFLFSLVF